MPTATQPPPPLPADKPGFGPRLVKGTTTGALSPPGFPTLRTIPATARLQSAGCNVFGMASKKESLILKIPDLGPAPPAAADVAALAALELGADVEHDAAAGATRCARLEVDAGAAAAALSADVAAALRRAPPARRVRC